MTRNEIWRQRRKREFRERILAAIEKPKQIGIWAALGHPFSIWLLTLVFVSILGTVYTTRSRCYEEAERFIESYEKLMTELTFRQTEVGRAASASTTMKELRERFRNLRPSLTDLRSRPFPILFVMHQRLRRQIYVPPDHVWESSRPSPSPNDSKVSAISIMLHFSADEFEGYQDADLAVLKGALVRREWIPFDLPFMDLKPACSLWSAIRSMAGWHTYVAELRYPDAPVYEPPNFGSGGLQNLLESQKN